MLLHLISLQSAPRRGRAHRAGGWGVDESLYIYSNSAFRSSSQADKESLSLHLKFSLSQFASSWQSHFDLVNANVFVDKVKMTLPTSILILIINLTLSLKTTISPWRREIDVVKITNLDNVDINLDKVTNHFVNMILTLATLYLTLTTLGLALATCM